MIDLTYWLLLQSIEGIGPITFRNLLEKFNEPKQVFELDQKAFEYVPRLNQKIIDQILIARSRISEIDLLLEQLRNRNIEVVTINEPAYPQKLHHLNNPPPIIYLSRQIPTRKTFGIVGTRDASQYGKEQAQKFAIELSNIGFNIISGYAKGIDIGAHYGAITAKGQTVLVLPTGILKFELHSDLFDVKDIFFEHATVLSEFFPNREWSVSNALLRNRITAMLSDYLLVVESGESGGTLNTVEQAKIMAKKVFLYMGISSAMDEKIIQLGAIPVKDTKEILSQLDN